MKKGNKALQEAVNKALKELKEDGTYQKSTTNGSAITTKNNIYPYELG